MIAAKGVSSGSVLHGKYGASLAAAFNIPAFVRLTSGPNLRGANKIHG
jgi:hypothetical protein